MRKLLKKVELKLPEEIEMLSKLQEEKDRFLKEKPDGNFEMFILENFEMFISYRKSKKESIKCYGIASWSESLDRISAYVSTNDKNESAIYTIFDLGPDLFFKIILEEDSAVFEVKIDRNSMLFIVPLNEPEKFKKVFDTCQDAFVNLIEIYKPDDVTSTIDKLIDNDDLDTLRNWCYKFEFDIDDVLDFISNPKLKGRLKNANRDFYIYVRNDSILLMRDNRSEPKYDELIGSLNLSSKNQRSDEDPEYLLTNIVLTKNEKDKLLAWCHDLNFKVKSVFQFINRLDIDERALVVNHNKEHSIRKYDGYLYLYKRQTIIDKILLIENSVGN